MIHRLTLWVHHRTTHHTQHKHIQRQQRVALLLITTALLRVLVWTLLTIFYLIGVGFAVSLFKSVAFVALISMFALILTDWSQMAASLAQLTAGDVHQAVTFDTSAIEQDVAKLAALQPGPDGQALADAIVNQLKT